MKKLRLSQDPVIESAINFGYTIGASWSYLGSVDKIAEEKDDSMFIDGFEPTILQFDAITELMMASFSDIGNTMKDSNSEYCYNLIKNLRLLVVKSLDDMMDAYNAGGKIKETEVARRISKKIGNQIYDVLTKLDSCVSVPLFM